MGKDLYREALSEEGDVDSVFRIAFWPCEGDIFSGYGDIIPFGLDAYLYELNYTALGIWPEEITEDLMECLKEAIGLESLLEVGFWDGITPERAPIPEELAAAEGCKLGGEG